jgi:hypothetical protein
MAMNWTIGRDKTDPPGMVLCLLEPPSSALAEGGPACARTGLSRSTKVIDSTPGTMEGTWVASSVVYCASPNVAWPPVRKSGSQLPE